MQQSGTENRIALHLPDGPEQLARDAQFQASATGSNPDKWNDRQTQNFLWGWDAEQVAFDAWRGKLYRQPCGLGEMDADFLLNLIDLTKDEKVNASL